jgi:hypothetical protein
VEVSATAEFVAHYAVAHAAAKPPDAQLVARMVREMVRADIAAQAESRSPADDDLRITSFVAVDGPLTLGRQVGYTLRHRCPLRRP